MGVYFYLGCVDCKKQVYAADAGHCGNNCGDYQKTLDFIVEHTGHSLVSFSDHELMDEKTGKIRFCG